MGNIGLGLQLMLIGMVTVFIILMIVIYSSKLLILIINKIAPEQAAKPEKKAAADSNVPVDVLNAAVAQLTGGKGHIVNITKVS